MKRILVPTDFSKCADNALEYSIQLAKKENAQLILLHAINPNYNKDMDPFDPGNKELKNHGRDAHKRLEVVAENSVKAGIGKPKIVISELSPSESILECVKESKVDLVVMGTKGINDFSDVVFGSNTALVIEKAQCPVISIPEEVKYRGVKRMTYATTFSNSDISVLKNIVELARKFRAQLNVLHVSDEKNSPKVEKDLMEKFMKDVTNVIDYNNMSFQVLDGENVEEALEKYIESDATDLLVMATHERYLFDKLFGESKTKPMIYNRRVPLMVFHYAKKTFLKLN